MIYLFVKNYSALEEWRVKYRIRIHAFFFIRTSKFLPRLNVLIFFEISASDVLILFLFRILNSRFPHMLIEIINNLVEREGQRQKYDKKICITFIDIIHCKTCPSRYFTTCLGKMEVEYDVF